MKELYCISVKCFRVMNNIFSDELVLSRKPTKFSFKDTNTDFHVGGIITHNRNYYSIAEIDFVPLGVYR